jgi:hypothetical protein
MTHLIRDFTSKHAMHANCDEDVRYAGEFHIHKKQNGKFVMYIDNNSGTYSPNELDLPVVAGLLEKNFPGLRVDWTVRGLNIRLNIMTFGRNNFKKFVQL